MKHVVTELVLDNGAHGLLIHIPDASVVNLEINFRAGDYLMPREKWEAPHLMEHVLLGANELIPNARAFIAEFEKNGAYNNASTSSYDITYEAECADFEWDRILGLMLTAITKPLFLDEEFQAEFESVREELTARSNNHFRHLSLALRSEFGFKVLTDQERLQLMDNVDLTDVRAHYESTHTAANLRFVIAGRLPARRQKIIKALLGSVELKNGSERLSLPEERPILLDKPIYIHNDSVDNLYFCLDTFLQRRPDDPEIDALGLANILLAETYYSRILGVARERGLIYHLSSGYGFTKNSGNWWVGSQVLPKNTRDLFHILVKEVTAVCKGKVPSEEITAAKQYALGRFQRGAQTVGGTAAVYAGRYYFDGQVDDYYQIPNRIEAVTKEQVVAIMKGLFADKTWGIGVLGNAGDTFADDLHTQLRGLWG